MLFLGNTGSASQSSDLPPCGDELLSELLFQRAASLMTWCHSTTVGDAAPKMETPMIESLQGIALGGMVMLLLIQ